MGVTSSSSEGLYTIVAVEVILSGTWGHVVLRLESRSLVCKGGLAFALFSWPGNSGKFKWRFNHFKGSVFEISY